MKKYIKNMGKIDLYDKIDIDLFDGIIIGSKYCNRKNLNLIKDVDYKKFDVIFDCPAIITSRNFQECMKIINLLNQFIPNLKIICHDLGIIQYLRSFFEIDSIIVGNLFFPRTRIIPYHLNKIFKDLGIKNLNLYKNIRATIKFLQQGYNIFYTVSEIDVITFSRNCYYNALIGLKCKGINKPCFKNNLKLENKYCKINVGSKFLYFKQNFKEYSENLHIFNSLIFEFFTVDGIEILKDIIITN